jgi:hypothetical protein
MTAGFEACTELAFGLSDALGDRSHLSSSPGQEHNDPVGFTQAICAQHDAFVAVQGHRVTAGN